MRLLLFILLITTQSFGATYYVKNGGGTGTGLDSNAQAWSYAKFNATSVPAGSTVLFRSGETFTGALTPRSGTNGNIISYGTYGGNGNATISGFTTLTSWTQHPTKSHVYYATISRGFIPIMTLDGNVQRLGRYPNTGFIMYTSHSGNSISATGISTLPANFIGGEVVIKKQRYLLDRHKITGKSGSTLTYLVDNFYGSNESEPTDNNGFFIQNDTSTLDQDGEWCHVPSQSRVYMYFAGTPSGRVVKASAISEVITLNGSSYISFNNLNINGGDAGVVNVNSLNITFNNCTVSQQAFGIYGNGVSGLQVNGGSVSDCASEGILVDAGGLNTIVDGVTVNRNGIFEGLGKSGDAMYNAVHIVGDGTIVKNSTVKNTGFNGISFEGNDVLIEKNFVDSFCIVKDDGSGIYTHVLPPNPGIGWTGIQYNRIIRNNIVTNDIGNGEGVAYDEPIPKGFAIYLDGYSNHTQVINNVCYGGVWGGIFLNGNSNNRIENNTIYDFQFSIIIFCTDTIPGASGTVKNDTIVGNKFIAKTANQQTLSINMFNKPYNPTLIGVFANNYYARPLNEGASIDIHNWYGGQNTPNLMTVAQWKTNYSQDAGSTASLATTSNVNNLRFDYNYSASPISVSLPGIYKSVSNSTYTGLVNIAPYGGELLMYSSALAPGDTKGLIIKMRKVITQ